MDYWDLYLLTRLDGLGTLLSFVTAVSFVVLGISSLYLVNSADSYMEREAALAKKIMNKALLVLIPSVLLAVAVPSEEDLAIIIAGGFVAQSETVSELGETAKLGVEVLNKYLEELKEE